MVWKKHKFNNITYWTADLNYKTSYFNKNGRNIEKNRGIIVVVSGNLVTTDFYYLSEGIPYNKKFGWQYDIEYKKFTYWASFEVWKKRLLNNDYFGGTPTGIADKNAMIDFFKNVLKIDIKAKSVPPPKKRKLFSYWWHGEEPKTAPKKKKQAKTIPTQKKEAIMAKKTKKRTRSKTAQIGFIRTTTVKARGYGKSKNTRYVRKIRKGVYEYRLKNR